MPSCHVPGRWWSPTLFPDLPALKGNPFLPWHLHSTADALTAGTQEVGFSINYLHYLWVISTFLVIMQHMKSTFGSLKYKIPVWMPLRLDEVRERLKEQVASVHDKRCARNAISGSKRPKRRLDPSSSSTCATLDELLVEWLRWDLLFTSPILLNARRLTHYKLVIYRMLKKTSLHFIQVLLDSLKPWFNEEIHWSKTCWHTPYNLYVKIKGNLI